MSLMSMIGGSDQASELAALHPWQAQAAPISVEERELRLDRARSLMADAGADAMIVFAGASLLYFTGIRWGATERLVAMILPRAGKPYIVAPAFERGSLDDELVIDAEPRFWEEDASPFALVGAILRELGADILAVDPLLPFGMADRLRKAAPSLDIVDATGVIDGCRSLKSPAELALIRQAMAMTLEVHRRAARILAPGIRASAVAAFIDQAHRALGASGTSFCQVQFGASTAYPHGLAKDDILAEGDVVLIDTGCAVQGYNSDITRSYVFGSPTAEHRRIWAIEQEAQLAAFDAARPGVPCEDVDRAARSVVERNGLGPGYRLPGVPHRTGHGIGLAIHEAPYLVRGERSLLAPGMCFSNEPTIVVPGKFGIRLEDHFHITESGAQWFTQPSASIEAPFA